MSRRDRRGGWEQPVKPEAPPPAPLEASLPSTDAASSDITDPVKALVAEPISVPAVPMHLESSAPIGVDTVAMAPKAPPGFTLCRVHHGSLQRNGIEYPVGAEVVLPASLVAGLRGVITPLE